MTDTDHIAAAIAVASAGHILAEAELRMLETEEAAETRLGIDLDTLHQQAEVDLAEAEADQPVMDQLRQRCATASTEEELRALVQEGRDLVARAEARHERRTQFEQTLARYREAWAKAATELQ
ncbi:hypothetical protein [Streptomyces bluensis]|uniref:hypothetical protein n=1 Tax=Streptomyces bluensis TaxID=33897 RepID=UPI0033183159